MLLLAKKRSALTALQDQFRERDTGKTYAALVPAPGRDALKVIDLALHKTWTPTASARCASWRPTTTAGARSRWSRSCSASPASRCWT